MKELSRLDRKYAQTSAPKVIFLVYAKGLNIFNCLIIDLLVSGKNISEC